MEQEVYSPQIRQFESILFQLVTDNYVGMRHLRCTSRYTLSPAILSDSRYSANFASSHTHPDALPKTPHSHWNPCRQIVHAQASLMALESSHRSPLQALSIIQGSVAVLEMSWRYLAELYQNIFHRACEQHGGYPIVAVVLQSTPELPLGYLDESPNGKLPRDSHT